MSEYLFDNAFLNLFAGDQPTDKTGTGVPPVEPHHIDLGTVYHLKYPHMKHEENSLHGLRDAKRLGFDSVDFDMTKGKSGRIRNNHWLEPLARDGFVDPLGEIPKHANINDLTDEEIDRLVAHTGDREYRIGYMSTRMRQAAVLKMKIRGEIKAGCHWTLEDMKTLRADQIAAGAIMVMTTLDTDPGWPHRMEIMRAVFPDVRRIHG